MSTAYGSLFCQWYTCAGLVEFEIDGQKRTLPFSTNDLQDHRLTPREGEEVEFSIAEARKDKKQHATGIAMKEVIYAFPSSLFRFCMLMLFSCFPCSVFPFLYGDAVFSAFSVLWYVW